MHYSLICDSLIFCRVVKVSSKSVLSKSKNRDLLNIVKFHLQVFLWIISIQTLSTNWKATYFLSWCKKTKVLHCRNFCNSDTFDKKLILTCFSNSIEIEHHYYADKQIYQLKVTKLLGWSSLHISASLLSALPLLFSFAFGELLSTCFNEVMSSFIFSDEDFSADEFKHG